MSEDMNLDDLPEPEACSPDWEPDPRGPDRYGLMLMAREFSLSKFHREIAPGFAIGADWAVGWCLALTAMGEAIREKHPPLQDQVERHFGRGCTCRPLVREGEPNYVIGRCVGGPCPLHHDL